MRFVLYSKDQDLEEAVFSAAMYWRILYGALRVFLGYKLLSLVGLPAVEAYQRLLRRELSMTHDAPFQAMGHLLAAHGFSITYFLAAYLLFWGTIDIALSISMLRHYLWAFSTSMALMGLFTAYEIYRFAHTHSPVLLSFILIDLFIIYLIHHERGRLIRRREKRLERKLRESGAA